MSETDLVMWARAGDQGAFERLAHRYRWTIHERASAYFLPGGEYEDLRQEGLQGLFKAVHDFDPSRSSFGHFARMCIDRQIITAVKAATRRKHEPLNNAYSFAQTARGAADDSDVTLEEVLPDVLALEPVEHLEQRREVEVVAGTLALDLSDAERDAVMGIAEGHSYKEIARRTGRDFKAIDNAAQRGKRKIRVALEAAA